MAKKTQQVPAPVRILRVREVVERTGLSVPSIYRLMGSKTDAFPRNVKIAGAAGHATGWVESEIVGWLEARIAEREAA